MENNNKRRITKEDLLKKIKESSLYLKVVIGILCTSVTLGACAGGCSLQKNNPKTVETNKETDDMDVPTVTPTEALVDEMIAESTVTPEAVATEEPVEEISEEQIASEVQMLNDVYNNLMEKYPDFNSSIKNSGVAYADVNAALVYGMNEGDVTDQARLEFASEHFNNSNEFQISIGTISVMYYAANQHEIDKNRDTLGSVYIGDNNIFKYELIPDLSEALIENSTLDISGFDKVRELASNNDLFSLKASDEVMIELNRTIKEVIINNYDKNQLYTSIMCFMVMFGEIDRTLLIDEIGFSPLLYYVGSMDYLNNERDRFDEYINLKNNEEVIDNTDTSQIESSSYHM